MAQQDDTRFLVLGGVAALSLLVAGYRPVVAAAKTGYVRLMKWRVARREFPHLYELADRMRHFFEDRTDTVHNALKYESSRDVDLPQLLNLWDPYFFRSLSIELQERIAAGPRTFSQLSMRLVEIQSLFNAYYRYCLYPVFERPSAEVTTHMSGTAEAALEDAREKIVRFRDDLAGYARRLHVEMPSEVTREFYLSRAKPFRRQV